MVDPCRVAGAWVDDAGRSDARHRAWALPTGQYKALLQQWIIWGVPQRLSNLEVHREEQRGGDQVFPRLREIATSI